MRGGCSSTSEVENRGYVLGFLYLFGVVVQREARAEPVTPEKWVFDFALFPRTRVVLLEAAKIIFNDPLILLLLNHNDLLHLLRREGILQFDDTLLLRPRLLPRINIDRNADNTLEYLFGATLSQIHDKDETELTALS